MESLLTIKEVCEKLRLSSQTIYKMLKLGVLHGVRVGNQWRFQAEKIDEWIQNQSQNQNTSTPLPIVKKQGDDNG